MLSVTAAIHSPTDWRAVLPAVLWVSLKYDHQSCRSLRLRQVLCPLSRSSVMVRNQTNQSLLNGTVVIWIVIGW